MKITTGKHVEAENFYRERLFLVEGLREILDNGESVLIDAPRRFGKTSVAKEYIRQEQLKADGCHVQYYELEKISTVDEFHRSFYKGMLGLFKTKRFIDQMMKAPGEALNSLARRIGKIDLQGLGIELKEVETGLSREHCIKRTEALLAAMATLPHKTVFVLDEFPDMVLEIKDKSKDGAQWERDVDAMLAWLRAVRQEMGGEKINFVFCGSVNFMHTLEEIGATKRVNDLVSLPVPVMEPGESRGLLCELFGGCGIVCSDGAMKYLSDLSAGGPPYYAQIVADELKKIRGREKTFDENAARDIINTMVMGEDKNLKYFHQRLGSLLSPPEREIAKICLHRLCGVNTMGQKELYDGFLHDRCEYDEYSSVLRRLIHEGYLMRDHMAGGDLRFVSPLLKLWWAHREGVA